MHVIDQPIRTYHVVLDASGVRVTGLAIAAFTVLLARNGVTTAEVVSLVEVGTGFYEFVFTPLLAGTYGLVITDGPDPDIPNSAETTITKEWAVYSTEVEAGIPSSALTTRAAFIVRFLGGTSTAGEDALIDALLPAVTDICQAYCGRLFLQDTYTEYLDGRHYESVVLTETPINSIISVHASTGAPRLYDASTLLDAASGYDFDSASGLLTRLDGWFPCGIKTVKVVYDGGYTTIPARLESAALEILATKFEKSKNRAAYSIHSISRGDGQVTYATESFTYNDIPFNARQTLDEFRFVGRTF